MGSEGHHLQDPELPTLSPPHSKVWNLEVWPPVDPEMLSGKHQGFQEPRANAVPRVPDA